MHNLFTLLITGATDNDVSAKKYIERDPLNQYKKTIFFKLIYTAPYQAFEGIRRFYEASRYHPFSDPIIKNAFAVIDLTEWAGHVTDDYLVTFLKFLHDYKWCFFHYHYIFIINTVDREEVDKLYKLTLEYLGEGKVEEDKILTDRQQLQCYLMEQYPVDDFIAKGLADILIKNGVKGYSQLETVMQDLVNKVQYEREVITETQILKSLNGLKNSKLYILYKKEIEQWEEICREKKNREEMT